jgi:hypothetical protein
MKNTPQKSPLSKIILITSLISISSVIFAEENKEEAIGQAPEEDISHLFLRNSEVLLKPSDIQLSIGLDYNSNENQESFRKNRNRSLSIPLGISYGFSDRVEINASVPLIYKANEVISSDNVAKNKRFGIGDLSLGVSYTLKKESETFPAITSTFSLTAPTGNKQEATVTNPLTIGSGFWGVSTGLSVSKSIDPAVVFFNIGYQHTFDDERNGVNIQPGASFQYGFGAGLSVNSAISFSGRISGSYQKESQTNNQRIRGSSGEPISFVTSMSYRVSQTSRLETSLNIGLTEDASDIGIGVSYLWDLK